MFEILNSNTLISEPSLKSDEFINLPEITSFMYNIRPPPFFSLFSQNTLWPSAKNREFENESSILLSDDKQISVPLRATSLKPENVFLIELILRCPIITFLG